MMRRTMLRVPGLLRQQRRKAAEERARRRQPLSALFRRGGSGGAGESGETMLEFAFVAPMLILLFLTIIDLGIMLMTQSLLDGSTRDAARLIRTGQVSAAGGSITTFQNLLCQEMSPIMSTSTCQSQVLIDVNVYTTFGNVGFTPCTYNVGQTGSGTQCGFSPGDSSQIIGVQVTYNRRFIVPWVGACLAGQSCWMGINTHQTTTSGNAIPLISTVVFMNEPFPGSSG